MQRRCVAKPFLHEFSQAAAIPVVLKEMRHHNAHERAQRGATLLAQLNAPGAVTHSTEIPTHWLVVHNLNVRACRCVGYPSRLDHGPFWWDPLQQMNNADSADPAPSNTEKVDRRSVRSLDDPETLRLLIRSIGEGIYITDGAGRFLDANAAFLEIFGVASLTDLQRFHVPQLLADPGRREQEMQILATEGQRARVRAGDRATRWTATHGARHDLPGSRSRHRRDRLPRRPDRHHAPEGTRGQAPRAADPRRADGLLQPALPVRPRGRLPRGR